MARRSPSPNESERWQRQQIRELERQQRATAAAAKAADRAKRDQHIADQKRETELRTAEVETRARQLQAILTSGLRHTARIDLTSLKRQPSPQPFNPGDLAAVAALPAWGQFEPPQPGMVSRLLGGQSRYQQQLSHARAAHQQAMQAWQVADADRRRRLDAARSNHDERVRQHLAEVEEHNRHVEQLITSYRARDRKTVESVLGLTLNQVPLPDDFPRRAEITFSPQQAQIVVRMQLPGREAVPTVRGYKYVQTRDEIQPVPRPTKETSELYRSLVAQVALLTLHNLFEADPQLASIGFNGHVDAINPGTGQREYPCLISLNVERELFAQLVLAQVRPEVCLRHLNALVSPHPYELEPITPILDFDLTKFSFVDGLDAVSTLDSRPDLMKMSPTEFEHLVRQIFEAMGVESWTTEQNYDDGVDAVVVNRSALLGRLSIVQAKRYKDAVGVSHIRELAGAIEEKKAGHGILVTTSWFTPRSWQKAREHGRIELIDGNRLTYLIKEHLGKDVLIGIKRPRTATTGPDGASAATASS
ncbi:restriction endonuclease [Micromonospora sp. C31]|uniref:restriction endonuclease n=1 Tax=Micromonospora sp. C31 TaxID=2824876 RepID=UPI001B386EDD|nr:restriction endonuclease [Micromonospora sp. C31]MBQ1076078.1 restriction endonuclease [Micromonospora sp. C31]